MIRCHSLHVYPLKSAKGHDLDEAVVERRGLRGDRRWMVVDAASMTFLSQRSHPDLTRIGVDLRNGDLSALRLSAPGRDGLDVDLTEETETVEVWGDAVEARVATEAASRWLRDVLGMDVRLVFMPDESLRRVDDEYATDEDDVVSFADGYPLLLTTTASLDALNARIDDAPEAPLPMDRFRPNLVVSGAEAWAEDTWRQLRVGDVTFQAVKPCGRCSVTTVDQQTAERGAEPLQTLATFRRSAETGKTLFGWNLIPESTGTIRVGDPVEVLETGSPVALQ